MMSLMKVIYTFCLLLIGVSWVADFVAENFSGDEAVELSELEESENSEENQEIEKELDKDVTSVLFQLSSRNYCEKQNHFPHIAEVLLEFQVGTVSPPPEC